MPPRNIMGRIGRCKANSGFTLMETDAIPCRLIHSKKRLEQTEWDIILGYARRV